jgi:hypothetical protein
MVQITEIKLAGDEKHENISEVKWINPVDKKTGTSTKQVMVDFIKGGGQAVVTDGVQTIKVAVVDDGATPYIRTIADGVWTDNLLSLPSY